MAEFRLLPLLEAGRTRLESAEQRIALLRKRWNDAQEKLAQLDRFRTEYDERLAAELREGMTAHRQHDFLAFLAKLDLARTQQAEEVARCEQAWQSGLAEWQALKTRQEALIALQDRHRMAEELRERRQDQKLQDEFAARRGMNLPGGS